MSVASELADLNTNINSLKTAIVAKGGTVAEGAGLNALATAVGTIPGSSPQPTYPAYGQVVYYYDAREEIVAEPMECSVTVTNPTALKTFFDGACGEYDTVTLRYFDGTWSYEDMTTQEEVEVPDISAIGLSVSGIEGDMAEIYLYQSVVIYKESGTRTIDIDTTAKLNGLCGERWYTVGDTRIYAPAVKKYAFGLSVTALPDYFLYYASNVEEIDASEATNLVSTGYRTGIRAFNLEKLCLPALTTLGGGTCIYGAKYLDVPNLTTLGSGVSLRDVTYINWPKVTAISNYVSFPNAQEIWLENVETIGDHFRAGKVCKVVMPKVRTIGDYFLNYIDTYTITLELGSTTLTSIGSGFLTSGKFSTIERWEEGKANFDSYLYLPSTISSIGTHFMSDCQNFTGNIQVECPASVVATTQETGGDGYVLSVSKNSYNHTGPENYIYSMGFYFDGTEKTSWATRFPTIDGVTVNGYKYYRKTMVS